MEDEAETSNPTVKDVEDKNITEYSFWPFVFTDFPKLDNRDDIQLLPNTVQGSHQNLRELVHKSDTEGFVCRLCGVGIHKITTMLSHMKDRHGVKQPFICLHCGRKFHSYTALYQHAKAHAKKRTYSMFSLEDFLDASMVTNEKYFNNFAAKNMRGDFECLSCAVVFKKMLPLLAHIKKDHKVETTYKCTMCESAYKNKSGLYSHALVNHSGIKSVMACELCGQHFYHTSLLKEHLLIHSGEKSYICNFCSKGFARRRDLTRHIRTQHLNERNHICLVCGLACSQASNLKNHMKVHLKKK